MLVVEFDGPPSWSLDANKTEESTKCPWVEAMELIVWSPPPLPTGSLCCPQFQLHQESPSWWPVEFNGRPPYHRKVGDCEQACILVCVLRFQIMEGRERAEYILALCVPFP